MLCRRKKKSKIHSKCVYDMSFNSDILCKTSCENNNYKINANNNNYYVDKSYYY